MCCLVSIMEQLTAGLTYCRAGALASDCSRWKKLVSLGQEAEGQEEKSQMPQARASPPTAPRSPEPEVPQEHGLAPAQGTLGLGVSTPLQAVGCGLQCTHLFRLCLQAPFQLLVLPQEGLHIGQRVLVGAGKLILSMGLPPPHPKLSAFPPPAILANTHPHDECSAQTHPSNPSRLYLALEL